MEKANETVTPQSEDLDNDEQFCHAPPEYNEVSGKITVLQYTPFIKNYIEVIILLLNVSIRFYHIQTIMPSVTVLLARLFL